LVNFARNYLMMKAWLIHQVYDLSSENSPLKMEDVAIPEPGEGELLVKVNACGICHTEIDEIEGRTPPPAYPVIPGHQVIGLIEKATGKDMIYKAGDRVGVAWIFSACGRCEFCLSEHENLCQDFKATGRDAHGGYSEYMVVPEKFVYKIPDIFTDAEAAPLLCAGAIGYRSVSLCNMKNGNILGLTGFGASAHLVVKLVRYQYPDSKIFVFARSSKERDFARYLGCDWAGDTKDRPPQPADCIIDTTPVWLPVVEALECLKPGGRLVINAIRKETADKEHLLNLDYSSHLWMEKEIKSVANVTRKDVEEFIKIAAEIPFRPETEIYPFEDANRAIMDIKQRRIRGAKVLML
jgi:propanol-preferring alcohol dehydrogenase